MVKEVLVAIGFLVSLIPYTAQAQKKSRDVRTLERERKEILKQIEGTNQRLREVKKSTQTEEQRLRLVSEKVKKQAEVVGILNEEVEALQERIDSLDRATQTLNQRETQLKKQYERSVRALAGRDQSAEKIMLLLQSNTLEELVRKEGLLRLYAGETRKLLGELRMVRRGIEQTHQAVNATHQQKQSILQLRDQEKQKLEQEQGVRTKQVQSLKVEAQSLNQQLSKQRQQADQLSRRIEEQIAKEIAESERQVRLAQERAEARRKRREEKRRKQAEQRKAKEKPSPKHRNENKEVEPTPSVPTPSDKEDEAEEAADKRNQRQAVTRGGYAMDREELALSGSFAANRGRMPMPIRGQYDLLRGFGVQTHEEHSRVQIISRGIDLRPRSDSRVYAVFEGVVSRVFVTPGYGTSIILRHGNYLTVYAHLASVSVGQGQRVRTGQPIGVLAYSSEEKGLLLHFQVWHERSKQNPLSWIRRK